jgi:uncharacterized protein YlxW (UPF0749 family)
MSEETTDASTEPAPKPHPGRWRPDAVRIAAGAIAVLLLGLLGFAIAVQVHANSRSDNLANLREDDLIGILDDQNNRAERLRQEIADLQNTLRQLQGSGDRSAAARQQALQEEQALGVLLGTVPATGQGVMVTITDPKHKLAAEDLLAVVEELRGAGAEAIQFATVRVSTDTAFTEVGGSVAVDSTALRPPYQILAIGDRTTLDTALNIPGGVGATVRAAGGSLEVSEQLKITISQTRTLPTPKYAVPSGH